MVVRVGSNFIRQHATLDRALRYFIINVDRAHGGDRALDDDDVLRFQRIILFGRTGPVHPHVDVVFLRFVLSLVTLIVLLADLVYVRSV